MTLPFFGSGIVELPPEGFKRAKNSRKMQMVFFVHVGKVLVTVGPPAIEQNGVNDAETNKFAISKGGVWVVPRGEYPDFFPFHLHHIITKRSLAYIKAKLRGRRAVSSTRQLIFRRCSIGRAVCATSRRNNLSIAPEHRTSSAYCYADAASIPMWLSGTVLPLNRRLCSKGYIADGNARVCSVARHPDPLPWECGMPCDSSPPCGGAIPFPNRSTFSLSLLKNQNANLCAQYRKQLLNRERKCHKECPHFLRAGL